MLGKDNLPRNNHQPYNDVGADFDDDNSVVEYGRAPSHDKMSKKHRGKIAAGMAVIVFAGAMANCAGPHFGLSASVKAQKGSSTKAEILSWKITSDIIAANATFDTQSSAGINVHMQYDLPGGGIPLVGSAIKFIGDKTAPDYKEAMSVTCAGNMQEIVPAAAITKSVVANKLVETIDMSKIVMNPYCVSTTAEDDPGASKQLYAGEILFRDGVTKIGKLAGVLGDNSLAKPDVLMQKVTDNSKNTLAAASLRSMMSTCGPQLRDVVEVSAVQGVTQTILSLSDLKKSDISVVPSYRNGPVHWTVPKNTKIQEIKGSHMKLGPTLDKFVFDHASCSTKNIKNTIVGEYVKPKATGKA